jgi:hypothetical protein
MTEKREFPVFPGVMKGGTIENMRHISEGVITTPLTKEKRNTTYRSVPAGGEATTIFPETGIGLGEQQVFSIGAVGLMN